MSLVCIGEENHSLNELKILGTEAQSKSPDDEIIIRKIADRLDGLRGMTATLAAYEKGVLIELSVFVHPSLDKDSAQAAEDRRRKVLEPHADVPFRTDMDGKELLYFAAGTLGVPIDQKGMMGYAKSSGHPLALRLRAFKAILGQKRILPELEGDLVALSQDDLNFSADGDVGPRTNERHYPIREAAAEVMKKLEESPPGEPDGTRPSKRAAGEVARSDRDRTPVADRRAARSGEEIENDADPVGRISRYGWIGMIAAAIGVLWFVLGKRHERS